jgi:hypothetical protein
MEVMKNLEENDGEGDIDQDGLVSETCRQFYVLKWQMYIYHWPYWPRSSMYYILIKLTLLSLIGGLIYTFYLTVVTRCGSKILFLPGKAVYPAVRQHTCLIPAW